MPGDTDSVVPPFYPVNVDSFFHQVDREAVTQYMNTANLADSAFFKRLFINRLRRSYTHRLRTVSSEEQVIYGTVNPPVVFKQFQRDRATALLVNGTTSTGHSPGSAMRPRLDGTSCQALTMA